MFAWSFSWASQFSCHCKVVCLSVLDGFFRTRGVVDEAFQYYPSFHLESSLFGFGFSLPCFFSDDSLAAYSWLTA